MNSFGQLNEEIPDNIDISSNKGPLPAISNNDNYNQQEGMVIRNQTSNLTEEISKNTMSRINTYLNFIGKYFDVEMSDILLKLKGAIIPFNKSFHEVAESKPDLYGPFWIYTTIIFLITVAGNISGYLHTQQGEQFHYNYSFIPYAALFIYGFGFGAPLILFLVMKLVFKIEILLMVNICVYGYSFIVLIPVLFLCMIPSNFVETILLLYFIIHSGIFLFYNMWVIIQDKADKAKYVVLGILGGIHVILFFGLKCYFFAEANVQTKK